MTTDGLPRADLPDLVALAQDLDGNDPGEAGPVLHAVLDGVRDLLGMDVAFIGEITEGQRIFRHVVAPPDSAIREGGADPLEATYCQRVVDGRLPQLIVDAAEVPEAADLGVTAELPVGTHLSVPIRFSDGRVYGTFCAFSHQPVDGVRERDLGTLRLLAALVARYLERESAVTAARAQATSDVLEVLALGCLRMVFQPIIDLRTGRPAGYEALSRFPTGRPDEWFARAAGAGLAVPLELAALDEAARHVPCLPEGTYLAVNLSPETMCTPQFAARAERLPLDRLVLELTEQTEVTTYEVLTERVAWLRTLGGRVAVDDAGAGYAGLQRIVAITPDVLKLDAHLTRGVGDSAARQAMARAMAWFADRIGADLVAEGVETERELAALRGLGVDYVQGYHTGRPRAELD